MERFIKRRLPGQVWSKTVRFIGNLFHRGLPWFGGLFRHRFIKFLYFGGCNGFLGFLLRGGIGLVRVLAGFDGLDDSDGVVFGELDPTRNLGIGLSPDLAQLQEGGRSLESVCRLS